MLGTVTGNRYERMSDAPRAPSQGSARQRALLALAVVLAVALGMNTVWRACYMSVERSDFPVYLAAARAVLDGTDLYAARSARGWYYAYPPPFARR